jgi:hypothetical protein
MMNIKRNWPIPCRRHEAETDGMGEVLSDTASQESMTLVPSSTSSKDTVFWRVSEVLDPENFVSSSALGHTQRYDTADTTTMFLRKKNVGFCSSLFPTFEASPITVISRLRERSILNVFSAFASKVQIKLSCKRCKELKLCSSFRILHLFNMKSCCPRLHYNNMVQPLRIVSFVWFEKAPHLQIGAPIFKVFQRHFKHTHSTYGFKSLHDASKRLLSITSQLQKLR